MSELAPWRDAMLECIDKGRRRGVAVHDDGKAARSKVLGLVHRDHIDLAPLASTVFSVVYLPELIQGAVCPYCLPDLQIL